MGAWIVQGMASGFGSDLSLPIGPGLCAKGSAKEVIAVSCYFLQKFIILPFKAWEGGFA